MIPKHDVFISYKAEEYVEASWVKSVLEENGFTCWMAPASIPGGSSYADEIENAIINCSVFVLILSQKAQESKWVKKELDVALNKEKIILPFMIENCQLQKAFNYYLTDVQRYNAYISKVKAMDEMVARINAVLNNPISQVRYNEQIEECVSIPKSNKHRIRSLALFIPYLMGLFLPLFLFVVDIQFGFILRIVYFCWILGGALWIWNQIETKPNIAALCYGTIKEEEINDSPSALFSKVISVFGKKSYISNECPEDFLSFYNFKRFVFGTWDGKRTNYLNIKFKQSFEYYDPSVLYLHSLSRGNQAIKMLSRQGFVLKELPAFMSEGSEYLRKEELHVVLKYKKKKLTEVSIYNCSMSDFEKFFQEK